ncbi:hypothetical protein GCM10010182_71270 [Actinomadura cremea]|nr:hypothetical protein GCM10010182_71270 [Actinomadura cremea]
MLVWMLPGGDQAGGDGGDERFQELVQVGDLGGQPLVAAGRGPQGDLGGALGRGGVGTVGSKGGAGGDQVAGGQAAQACPRSPGAVTISALICRWASARWSTAERRAIRKTCR